MANARVPLDPVADLKRRLVRKQPIAIRALVEHWWNEQGLAQHPAAVGKRIAFALLEQKAVMHQRAGIVVLGELLADHLRAGDLAALERLFARRKITDTRVIDELGVKVLGTLLHRVRGRADVARALVLWRNAETAWQRRAACAAFTALAPKGDDALPNLVQLALSLCSAIVWSVESLDQTAVGWLLRELSRAEPTRIETFIRRHARFMSRACLRISIERLAPSRQREVVAHWKRATSLRRD